MRLFQSTHIIDVLQATFEVAGLAGAASKSPSDSRTTQRDTETHEDATGTNGGAPLDATGQPTVSLHAATEAILVCLDSEVDSHYKILPFK